MEQINATESELRCIEQAMLKGEKTFTLRSQDLIAPAIVRTWAMAQRWLERQQSEGFSIVESVQIIEGRLSHVFDDAAFEAQSPKVAGAFAIADAMDAFSPKKVAD